MSITDSLIVMWCVCVIPWLLAGWFRIPRYARYIQQADYKYKNYGLLFSTNIAENQYFFLFVLVLISFPPISCATFFVLPRALFNNPFPAGIVYFTLFLSALLLAPHDRPNDQQFTFTQRTRRLVMIAFFIELLPLLIGTWLIWGAYNALADPRNSPESMGVLAIPILGLIILLSASIGPVAFILTRYTLAVANVIDWPLAKVIA